MPTLSFTKKKQNEAKKKIKCFCLAKSTNQAFELPVNEIKKKSFNHGIYR